MMNKEIVELYSFWKDGRLSDQQNIDFKRLLQDESARQALIEHWTSLEDQSEWSTSDDAMPDDKEFQSMFENILLQSVPVSNPHIFAFKKIQYWKVAAAILVLLTGVISFALWRYAPDFNKNVASLFQEDMLPATNAAVLTFSNGKTLELSKGKEGIVVGQELRYSDGQILDIEFQTSQYATLTVPKGAYFHVELSDGTKVWLNSDSRLEYPVLFGSQEERIVKLTGEAYFEVAHDPAKPFFVKSDRQMIRVYGTRFNVKAFPGDKETLTTLLEGSVGVLPWTENIETGSFVKMSPNEQISLRDNQIIKRKVNVEKFLAWKQGLFVFEDDSIQEIMKELERWYDVQIVYENQPSTERYNGILSRNNPVSKVLAVLGDTDEISFRIVNKTIYITNNQTRKL